MQLTSRFVSGQLVGLGDHFLPVRASNGLRNSFRADKVFARTGRGGQDRRPSMIDAAKAISWRQEPVAAVGKSMASFRSRVMLDLK